MTPAADFLTIDFYEHPIRRTPKIRRSSRSAVTQPIDGLRSATVNYANNGTHKVVPKPTGTCLVLAWDSPDAARAAWAGPLKAVLGRSATYSLDGEVTRARREYDHNHWHGWQPNDDGATPLDKDEPMIAIVHGIVYRGALKTFLTDNVHAASRAQHHPGHRGSIDVFAKPPFENTSISLWSSLAQAQDFAYTPGGHAYAMKHSRDAKTHHTGVFLQVRPVASTGGLGRSTPSFADLPPAVR